MRERRDRSGSCSPCAGAAASARKPSGGEGEHAAERLVAPPAGAATKSTSAAERQRAPAAGQEHTATGTGIVVGIARQDERTQCADVGRRQSQHRGGIGTRAPPTTAREACVARRRVAPAPRISRASASTSSQGMRKNGLSAKPIRRPAPTSEGEGPRDPAASRDARPERAAGTATTSATARCSRCPKSRRRQHEQGDGDHDRRAAPPASEAIPPRRNTRSASARQPAARSAVQST